MFKIAKRIIWFCNDGFVLNGEEFDVELYKIKKKEKQYKEHNAVKMKIENSSCIYNIFMIL